MKSTFLLSALIPVISAHTRFTTLFVNGVSQGDGTCIRMDMSPQTTTFWIPSITSADMACGVQGGMAVNRTCPLKSGDSISLLHRVWPDGSQPGSIDPRHKGPTSVYMKKLANADSTDPYSTPASGDGWFKLAEIGYDLSSNTWGTDKMVANNGMVDATIPSGLSGGYYLVRSEILALQNVTNDKPQPQFYVGCAQVFVEGSASGDISAETVSIPGYVDADTPGLNYNIYSTPATTYTEYGPSVYGSVSARAVGDLAARSPHFRGNGSKHPKYINAVNEWANSDLGSEQVVDSTETATSTSIPAASTPTASTPGVSTSAAGMSTAASTVASSSPSTSSSRQSSPSQSTAASSSTSTASSSSSSTGSTLSIVGNCPADTILTVGNQCLTEIPSWSNDDAGPLTKCWAASKQCWATSSNCWANISPAVNVNDMNAGCHAWENKCNALDDWCHAGNLQGPPTWTGGYVSPAKKGKRDAARHIVAARQRGLRR